MKLLQPTTYKLGPKARQPLAEKTSKGYIAITTVLVVAAVTLAIAMTVTFLAIGDAQSSLASFKGEDNLHFVEGCMNDSILKIRNNAAYAGGTITYPEGSCTVTVSKVGTVYTITSTPVATTYVKKIQAVINRGATGVTITSWQEI